MYGIILYYANFRGYSRAWIGMQIACIAIWEDGTIFEEDDIPGGEETAIGDACVRLVNNGLNDNLCEREYGYMCERSTNTEGR